MGTAAPQIETLSIRRPLQDEPCPGPSTAEAVFEHLDEQLRLAGQVQRDLLPNPMPVSASASFHALFLPVDHVSGDIYDVVRLDESHLAVSLADATGHGMPAALLTVLIKRSFRGKTIENGSYRIMEPGEVLANVNRELLEMNLSHCQFVTGLHGVYDEEGRCLRWARGGVPHPVLVTCDADPAFVRSTGVLLGAVERPLFDVVEQPLQPGDKVYFYTDGLEALLCRGTAGQNPFDISASRWFRSLSGRTPGDALAEIADLRRLTPPDAWPLDDITVVCVECTA